MRYRKLSSLLVLLFTIAAAAVGASSSLAKPITKQNGSSPAFAGFTSICAVSGYASYGHCRGDVTTYTNITGRINAVQAKAGRYNLGFTFTSLTPGVTYTLWGNNGSFFAIASVIADTFGVARFSYQTTSPVGLGFDLNFADPNITVVTSYWSGQLLAMNPDGTLYAL
jgi:hypothetical protein